MFQEMLAGAEDFGHESTNFLGISDLAIDKAGKSYRGKVRGWTNIFCELLSFQDLQ